MAEALLRRELGPDARFVEVISAGVAAVNGAPATRHSLEVAAEHGVDLSSHRSRRLSSELAEKADLVLVMEPGHKQVVTGLRGGADQVHLISEWPEPAEGDLAVADPIGQSREAYEEAWRRISRHVARLLPRLREELRARRS
jgi:protein-tyrosine phosphatase